ncbi:MAG: prephenate dehydrogenase/arogenate dehydrogenase family protein [Spirochaetes bacterium]|jgi:prephenate dehydrogenase|nr:prephenate dehydrogenase/arogenate dehydrogenase family protein [Spirochaetota bacterium]
MSNKISVGIIGGTGGMGKLFINFFERHGIQCEAASRSTKLSVEECASRNDIVIITVPIASTIDTIKKIAPLVKEDGLLMDLTSLKKREVACMLEYSSCDVIGCHPVFGPSVSSFEKQVVVLTPARGDRWIDFLTDLLRKERAEVKISTPEEHDRIMAVVQGLMHFTSITLMKTLMKTGMPSDQFNEFSSPVYRVRNDFASRILNQNPELYADIELHNPETVSILQKYIESCSELLQIVKQGDRAGFINEFNAASEYVGDYKNIAEQKTNSIIDFVASLSAGKND